MHGVGDRFEVIAPLTREVAGPDEGGDFARERGRERSGAYRERRRYGLVLVSLEVGPRHIAALERLALLDVDDRDKASIAWAVSRTR
jgi:hypothetical protein